MPSLCRTKHNRAKPMFELPSAIFLIADGNEFRFARFYIVCEAVPLEALGNPLIVCGLPDTSVDCQSVAKTRNPMPGAVRIRNAGFCDQNRRRQVPPGTFYHSVFTCPCFSPPCPRDTPGFLCIYDSTTASPQGASVRTAPSATGVSDKSSVPAFPVWVTVRGSSE